MAEIVNLKRARKQRERSEKEKTAQANRVAHSTPKALKTLLKVRKDKAEQRLTGHELEKPHDDN